MTIELNPNLERMIARAIESGAYKDSNEVIRAALEMLAEDIEDVEVSKAREGEPRVLLEEVEGELRALGKLK
jgi:putative addiction module CopG family antidote